MTRTTAARRAGVVAIALLGLMGCRDAANATGSNAQQKNQGATPAAPATPVVVPFDANRAFEHVKKQVAFGPRPAGSKALADTRKYIEDELKSYGLTVREEPFTATTPNGSVDMVNVVAELPGATPDVLLLTSHYDTKILKDFVGANDGGSSTGCLMEIARVLSEQAKSKKFDMTIHFVFFDGEEAVREWTDTDSTYGSRHYVESHKSDGTLARVKAMVLLDMIGDRDLTIYREGNSYQPIADIIWSTGAALGYGQHFPNAGYYIEDDHIPFVKAKIPAVDLIDFQYGTDDHFGPGGRENAYWHAATDTVDKLSPDSLKVVGETIVASVPKIMAKLK